MFKVSNRFGFLMGGLLFLQLVMVFPAYAKQDPVDPGDNVPSGPGGPKPYGELPPIEPIRIGQPAPPPPEVTTLATRPPVPQNPFSQSDFFMMREEVARVRNHIEGENRIVQQNIEDFRRLHQGPAQAQRPPQPQP